jgi:hypothetical protein
LFWFAVLFLILTFTFFKKTKAKFITVKNG